MPDPVAPAPVVRSPRIGDLVLYTLPKHAFERSAGEIRPAIVVRTWGGPYVNLLVLLDGLNDHPYEYSAFRFEGEGDGYPGDKATQALHAAGKARDAIARLVEKGGTHPCLHWATSVLQDDAGAEGTFRFPTAAIAGELVAGELAPDPAIAALEQRLAALEAKLAVAAAP